MLRSLASFLFVILVSSCGVESGTSSSSETNSTTLVGSSSQTTSTTSGDSDSQTNSTTSGGSSSQTTSINSGTSSSSLGSGSETNATTVKPIIENDKVQGEGVPTPPDYHLGF